MVVEKQFNITLQNRKVLRSILTKLPNDVLNKIPEGYRNNLWWNLAHIVATQQILLYRLSGLPTRVDEAFVDRYKKGTAPESVPSKDEINDLSEILISSALQAEEDYNKGLFSQYNEYTTSTKVTLSSVEDGINFNIFHEGLHLGVILSQLKSLGISIF